MFSFLKKHKEETTTCICLVTGSVVTGSVVRTYQRRDAVAEPIVLFSCEEEISADYGDSREVIDILVQKAMLRVLEKCRSYYGSFDAMKCIIGEPWVVTKYRKITIEKNSPFTVTQKIIDEAIQRDMRLFEQETLRDFEDKEEVAIVDISKPVFFINGYKTVSWEKKNIKKIEIAQTIALAPVVTIAMIMETYADIFHTDDVTISAYSHSLCSVCSSASRNQTVVVLGGTMIDFYTLDQGVITQSLSYPGGVSDMVRTLELSFDIPQHKISTVFDFAHDENILEHYRDSYTTRLMNSYTALGNQLQKNILHAKKQGMEISDPLIILTHYSWMNIFQGLLERDLGASVVFPQDLTTEIIYTQDAKIRDMMHRITIKGACK
jgi:hypothetical protein